MTQKLAMRTSDSVYSRIMSSRIFWWLAGLLLGATTVLVVGDLAPRPGNEYRQELARTRAELARAQEELAFIQNRSILFDSLSQAALIIPTQTLFPTLTSSISAIEAYELAGFLEGRPLPEFADSEPVLIDIYPDSAVVVYRCKSADSAPPEALRAPRFSSFRAPTDSIKIKVAFHVVYTDDEGWVSEETINEQMEVLNDAFSQTLFSFELASIDSIKNETWFYDADYKNDVEREMKKSLAVDPVHVMNIYTTSGAGALGWAYFPWDTDPDSLHGPVVRYATLPGGTHTNYAEGATVVHEVGHHLGLWHTFEGGCDQGDEVGDTAAEGTSTSGCPADNTKDTCLAPDNDPNHPYVGYDPIHNYMDYSYDSCLNEFTPGQAVRMNWAVRKHRRGLFLTSPPNPPF